VQKSKVAYGQKAPFSIAEVEAIRASRALAESTRDRALFELALSSALRSSDLLTLSVADVTNGTGDVLELARARQRKTRKPVRFNITSKAQAALKVHIESAQLAAEDYLFTAVNRRLKRPLTSQAFRDLVRTWADAAGHRDTSRFAGHSTRRTLAVAMYNKTRDVAAVSKVLGHSSLRHTADYLGVSDEAALAIARDCAL